jgi:hypothetical protein
MSTIKRARPIGVAVLAAAGGGMLVAFHCLGNGNQGAGLPPYSVYLTALFGLGLGGRLLSGISSAAVSLAVIAAHPVIYGVLYPRYKFSVLSIMTGLVVALLGAYTGQCVGWIRCVVKDAHRVGPSPGAEGRAGGAPDSRIESTTNDERR